MGGTMSAPGVAALLHLLYSEVFTREFRGCSYVGGMGLCVVYVWLSCGSFPLKILCILNLKRW